MITWFLQKDIFQVSNPYLTRKTSKDNVCIVIWIGEGEINEIFKTHA